MFTARFVPVFAAVFFVFSTSIVVASEKAFTSTGEIVILNEDGTWQYENQSVSRPASKKIKTNTKKFKTPKKSNFPIKSKINSFGLRMNPAEWGFTKKGAINEEAEYEFRHKKLDIYAMAITESIEINLENLIEIAKENGSWTFLDEVEALLIPEDLKEEFVNYKGSKEYFDSLSKSVKKILLYWIVSAKRKETRQKRILEIAENASKNLKPKQFR